MAQITDKLSSLIKDKVLLKQKEESVIQDNIKINLRIISENSLSFVTMARDLNVARQNVQKLVKIMGGETKTGADDQYRTEEQRRKLAETRKEEIKAEEVKKKSPTSVKEQKKKPSLFSKFKTTKVGKKIGDIKKAFSVENIIKSFMKFFAIAGIIAIIYDSFKETLSEWASNLWDAIKEKFDEWINDIKQWFDEVVQPIIDGVKNFIDEMIEKVGNFFKSIGEWFSEKFGVIKEGFESALGFVKNIWDKFMGLIDAFKDRLRPIVAAAMKVPGAKYVIPDFLLTWLDLKKEEPKPPPKSAEETKEEAKRTTEKAKSDRERSDEAAKRAADTKGAEREQAEKEEREAADRARQSELEARNKRREARNAEAAEKGKPTPAPKEAPAEAAPKPAETAPAAGTPSAAPGAEPAAKPAAKPAAETPSAAPGAAPAPSAPAAEQKPMAAGAPEKAPERKEQQPKSIEKPAETPIQIKPETKEKGKKDATGGLKGRAAEFAEELEKYGITNKFAKQALVATSAKESGLNPVKKEDGAEAYLKTLKSRGIEYIWKVFPQLKPGYSRAKQLGFGETGVPASYLEKEWAKGDEAFFEVVYGGLGTNEKVGDGFVYRGRGLIGITGRKVYRNVGKEVGLPLEENPDIVSQDFKTAVAAAAGYIFMVRGGKKKALQDLNSFTDFDTALKYTLRTVAGLGHKEEDFEKKDSHLHEQLRKASQFKALAEETAEAKSGGATGAPVSTGAGVPLTSGATGAPVTSGYPAEKPKEAAPTPTPAPKPAPKTEAPTPKKGEENKVERDALKAGSTVEAAAKMIGLNENEHTKQLQEFLNKYSGTPWLPIDTDAGPWCAKFTNAILGSVGQKGTGSNMALSFLKYGGVVFDKAKKIGDITAAQPGDIMIQERGGGFGHVGFIESISGSNAVVVGGNQRGKPGENHSGGVTRMTAPLKTFVGIRRPGMPYTGEAIVPTNEEANKIAYEKGASSGPTLHAEGKPKNAPTGSDVGRTSTDIASQQRQQQKPSTPVVVNSPVTNNNTTVQNAPPAPAQQRDTAGRLVQRAA